MQSAFARIERRTTHYRFDLERDIPWDLALAPGVFFPDALLDALGVSSEELSTIAGARELLQPVLALATCDAFARLEEDVIAFLKANQGRIPEPRSARLLVEEEAKHAELFRRYARVLRDANPDAAARFDRLYVPPLTFCEAFPSPDRLGSERDYQYLFWRNTTFFEEYTVYFYERLAEAEHDVQPCWLSIHACHRREELQHLVTDTAYVDALAVPAERKEALSKLFELFVRDHFDAYFGRAVAMAVLAELAESAGTGRAPAKRSFDELPFARDLREHKAFRRTRAAGSEARKETGHAVDVPVLRKARPEASLPVFEGNTLVERLVAVSAARPNAGIVFVEDDNSESRLRYADLLAEAKDLAGSLAALGVGRGDPLVLQLLRPRDLLVFFWACLVRGAVAVPLSPPMSIRDGSEELAKLQAVHRALGRPRVVVDDVLHPFVSAALAQADAETLALLVPAAAVRSAAKAPFDSSVPAPDSVAFVQFSSGSVGAPRGVGLSHENLLSDCEAMVRHRQRASTSDVFASWMPLYHDMGLIGYHLTPLVHGAEQVLMTPVQFLRDPLRWLDVLSRHRVTVTGAPNFALARVVDRLTRDRAMGLDLSALHTFLVGAEPIAWNVLARFIAALAPAKLAPHAMCPGYGLAEATLAVTMLEPGRVPSATTFRRGSLWSRGGVEVTSASDPEAITLVDVGVPIPGVRVRITDESGAVVPAGVGGRIEVSGRTVMGGYFGEAKGTALRGEWLDTQDLGVIHNGRLYVTGRVKDVFFIAGKNYFAHDIEAAIREVKGVRPGYVALVVDWDDRFGVDKLFVFVACEEGPPDGVRAVLESVRDHVRRRFGLDVDSVLAIDKRSFPRTTSGKLQRYRLLERFRNGAFAESPRSEGRKRTEEPTAAPATAAAAPVDAPSPEYGRVLATVRTLWAEVLAVPAASIGEEADFFSLGGSSILAAEVHGRLEKALRTPLALDVLLRGTTPKALATEAARALERNAGTDLRTETHQGRSPEDPPPTPTAPPIAERRAVPSTPRGADRALCRRAEPVAIVAVGVRIPGARGLSELARVLFGPTRVGPPPARWRNAAFGSRSGPPPAGAFLEDIEAMDAGAFGLSADEARHLDPHQRVFLEVALDALSGARVSRARVGVFVGAGDNEYGPIVLRDDARGRHALLGTLANMAAARVAQTFGLQGPAFTVNAACSSSLVAVHQACLALANGDCDVALAGGVQVNLTPRAYRYFSEAGLLSKTGECRPFDEHAEGLVPGEGAGAVLLKPLSRALEDGDPIVAVIRGSATNNDGGSLSGTAPNPAGQKTLLEDAYAAAGVSPSDVGYVEAHAAGTAVGDAIEVQALDVFFASAGRADSCPIGSVKGHVGHALAAAGILGLLKTVVALQSGEIPPTAGCTRPARRIEFGRTRLVPVTHARTFEAGRDGVRRAGVTSLGLGGTNCHVVLEQGPIPEPLAPAPGLDVFCMAAPEGRLASVAAAYRSALEAHPEVSFAAACAASSPHASILPTRKAIVAEGRSELLAALEEFAQNPSPPPAPRGKLVFVFPGPGAQVSGMGRFLLAREPAFREAFDRCHDLGRSFGIDLRGLIAGGDERLHRIDLAQPVTFAFGYALARWLEDLGVVPDIVLGHSAGEFAAAHEVSGLSLDDAFRLVVERGRAMAEAPPGAMAALFAPPEVVSGLLDSLFGAVTVAAYNGPEQTVVAGPEDAIRTLVSTAEARGISARVLRIRCAAHSRAMHAIRDTFATHLRGTAFHALERPLISTRTGSELSAVDETHWLLHLCEPVRFGQAIERAFQTGGRVFVELGASGGLSWCIDRILGARRSESAVVSLLRGEAPTGEEAVHGLATLYECGIDVRFERRGGRRSQPGFDLLPPMPLRREVHWLSPAAADSVGDTPSADPLIVGANTPDVRDHVTAGTPTAPAALVVDRVLARERRHSGAVPTLSDIVVLRPLAPHGRAVRLVIEANGNERIVRVYDEVDGVLSTHLTCTVTPPRGRVFGSLDVTAIRARCPRAVDPASVYGALAERGFVLGPAMRCIESMATGDGEVLVELVMAPGASPGHVITPSFVDAAAQSVVALSLGAENERALYLGFGIGEVAVYGPLHERALCYVRLSSPLRPNVEVVRFDIVLASPDGHVLAEIRDFSAKRSGAGFVATSADAPSAPSVDKRPAPLAAVPEDRSAGLNGVLGARPNAEPSAGADDVRAVLRECLARRLRMNADRIPATTPLSRVGVDSLMAVEVLAEVARRLDVRLRPTLLFEHRTLDALSHAIGDELRRTRG